MKHVCPHCGCQFGEAILSDRDAERQGNKAGAASSGADFKAADSGAGFLATDLMSRGLPNNPAAAAPDLMEQSAIDAVAGIVRTGLARDDYPGRKGLDYLLEVITGLARELAEAKKPTPAPPCSHPMKHGSSKDGFAEMWCSTCGAKVEPNVFLVTPFSHVLK